MLSFNVLVLAFCLLTMGLLYICVSKSLRFVVYRFLLTIHMHAIIIVIDIAIFV